MHALQWIEKHGRYRRFVKANQLRYALQREKRTCTWCGKPVGKGRSKWCSDKCVDEYHGRMDPQIIRRRVAERDRGVCAMCGHDATDWSREIDIQLRTFYLRVFNVHQYGGCDCPWCQYRDRRKWEADHIVPVCEGGGCCTIDNYRTLCLTCHKAESKRLSRRRAMIGKVHHQDAIKLMQEMQTCALKPALLFVDPPFNIGRDYEGYDDKKSKAEFEDFIVDLCWHGIRTIVPGGIFAIHCPDDIAALVLTLEHHEALDEARRVHWINWYYGFGQWTRSTFIQTRCHLLVYTNTEFKPTFNADDIFIESLRRKIGDPRAVGRKGDDGQWEVEPAADEGWVVPGTVWGIEDNDGPHWGRVQGNNNERWIKKNGALVDHDNQLPENYLERIIRAWTNPGELVCDPCGGSGTTAVVAEALQRRWITGDISKTNCASIRRRLKKGSVRL